MKLPFVTRARFEDKCAELARLRGELEALRYKHDRVLDEINFRSTGFHLDERFEKKEEAQPVLAQQPAAEEDKPSGIGAVIQQVGTRPSAIRSYMESTATSDYREKEKAYDLQQEAATRERAHRLMEEALKAGTAKAQA
jgi:hypothetical protein